MTVQDLIDLLLKESPESIIHISENGQPSSTIDLYVYHPHKTWDVTEIIELPTSKD